MIKLTEKYRLNGNGDSFSLEKLHRFHEKGEDGKLIFKEERFRSLGLYPSSVENAVKTVLRQEELEIASSKEIKDLNYLISKLEQVKREIEMNLNLNLNFKDKQND